MTLPTILKMIETVEPGDDKTLSEIDARVNAYVRNLEFVIHEITHTGDVHYKYKCDEPPPKTMHGVAWCSGVPKYTRSRDALKQIRPEGWCFTINPHHCIAHGPRIIYSEPEVNFFEHESLSSPDFLPTEELAELHAILQSIEWERNNGD